jgi:hypothetical protein
VRARPFRAPGKAAEHDWHHEVFTKNYALSFTYLDKLFGSYNKGRTPGEAVGLSRKQKEAARLAALEKAEPPQVQEVPSTSTSVSPSSTRPAVNAKADAPPPSPPPSPPASPAAPPRAQPAAPAAEVAAPAAKPPAAPALKRRTPMGVVALVAPLAFAYAACRPLA